MVLGARVARVGRPAGRGHDTPSRWSAFARRVILKRGRTLSLIRLYDFVESGAARKTMFFADKGALSDSCRAGCGGRSGAEAPTRCSDNVEEVAVMLNVGLAAPLS